MPFHSQRFLPPVETNEQVYLVLRKHWFVLASHLAVWVSLLLIILVVDGVFKTYATGLYAGRTGVVLSIIRSSFLVLTTLGIFMTWAMYYLNVQVVTNKRIIDIDQKSLLRHETSELHLQKVEDVTTEIHGPIQNFLDFGNITIQTAGEKEKFVFEAVAHPHRIARLILDLYEKVAPVSETAATSPATQTPPASSTNSPLV